MVLVTGGTGFLGSELISQLLKKGYPIRAIKRNTSQIPASLSEKNIEWLDADILDYDSLALALDGIDKIYHCAAFISFDPSDKKKLVKINATGTANIVNACLEHGQVKLVHVSSIAAISDGKPGQLITENDYWEFNNSQNAYAISKYEAEMEVWRGIAEGLNAVIVNPSLIIGSAAGEKGSGQLFTTVRDGLKFYTDGSCGLVDVEDVASIMISLMESDVTSERFIVNSENLSYKELFSETARGFSMKPPPIEAKPWMLGLAWRFSKLTSLLSGKTLGLTKDTARSAFKHQNYSNAKIKSALPGFEFKPLSRSIKEICATLQPKK
ncbi:NAD-dependent epimerase/dehydratase family protein [Pedobacter sp. HMF7647]|uniref:NAD-dependent epimerase/dehydratase family protein n=1 Tax=Hufsiella arboris TaxID=2695275 RepID=A0A7K1Y4D5_9SPHI|nr:NAD-dependent epimerase/dehydratase family protein [Hufsiella arboris]MXV49424.1 NAD-dependent epimerase/dehydratase family protein [Hufsiella arboris]